MFKFVSLLLVLLMSVNSNSLLAETPPPRTPIPFATFDQDGNKSISPEEFNVVHEQRQAQKANSNRPIGGRIGKVPSFETFDANKDGQISPEELIAGQQKRQEQQAQNKPMGMGMKGMQFSDVDKNADGTISEEEFNNMKPQMMGKGNRRGCMGKNRGNRMQKGQQPSFESVDANSDGSISTEEFRTFRSERMQERAAEGKQMKGARKAASFESIDSNGDGKISAEEFAAHQANQVTP